MVSTSIERALEQLSRGGVVIVSDSLARENEGDFLAAAELITAETIHFMTTYGRGHLCQPVSSIMAARLDLQPLVPENGPDAPSFAMPLDHRECSTGISPLDREITIRSIADPSSRPSDFCRPGHIFPLIANEGGVLSRPGHTESAIDLMALAGLSPSGVLCEICSRDGRNMASIPELEQLAHEHNLPIVTIDDLVEYRRTCSVAFESGATFDLAEKLSLLRLLIGDEIQPSNASNSSEVLQRDDADTSDSFPIS